MKKRVLRRAAVLMMAVMMLGSTLIVHAEDGVYTVKRGDNLSKIAKEVYGNSNEWRTIYEANKGIIKNSNILFAGQQLLLPGASAIADTPLPSVPEAVPANVPAENTVHTLNMVLSTSSSIADSELLMGTGEFSYHRTPDNEEQIFSFEEDGIKNYYKAPAGYVWRETDVNYATKGGVFHDYFFYKQVSYTGNGISNWRLIENKEKPLYTPFDEHRFTLSYNGKDYTECKLLCDYLWDYDSADTNSGVLRLIVLLPEGYDGALNYTLYGSQLVNGQAVISNTEYLTIPF